METVFQHNYDAAVISGFCNEVQIALIKTAVSIQNEDDTALTVPPGIPTGGQWGNDEASQRQELHNRRGNLAVYILHDPTNFTPMFSRAIASNLDLYPDPNDASKVLKASDDTRPTKSDLESAVSSLWNAFSVDLKA
jgi:hypothetical protein